MPWTKLFLCAQNAWKLQGNPLVSSEEEGTTVLLLRSGASAGRFRCIFAVSLPDGNGGLSTVHRNETRQATGGVALVCHKCRGTGDYKCQHYHAVKTSPWYQGTFHPHDPEHSETESKESEVEDCDMSVVEVLERNIPPPVKYQVLTDEIDGTFRDECEAYNDYDYAEATRREHVYRWLSLCMCECHFACTDRLSIDARRRRVRPVKRAAPSPMT